MGLLGVRGNDRGDRMRASQRVAIIDRVASELQSRYTFHDIDLYLQAFKIKTPHGFDDFDSKAAYAKTHLGPLPSEVLARMAEDLELGFETSAAVVTRPKNWQDSNDFKLFVSHLSAEKAKATRLRDCLEPFAISAFVAHEDIRPTAAWQVEIERALRTMDAFLAIHTAGFSQSFWTQQEIGFAVCRGVKIISLKMGEDPTGFISVHQALPRLGRTAEAIAQEIDTLLKEDPRTSSALIEAMKASIPF